MNREYEVSVLCTLEVSVPTNVTNTRDYIAKELEKFADEPLGSLMGSEWTYRRVLREKEAKREPIPFNEYDSVYLRLIVKALKTKGIITEEDVLAEVGVNV